MTQEPLESRVAVLEATFKSCVEMIKEIREAVVGNGNPGLKTTAELNKQGISRIWWTIGILFSLYGGILGIAIWKH